MSESEFMDIHDTAVLLGVCDETVYRLAWRCQIPAAKVGKHWRFSRQQVRQWIESQAAERLAAGQKARR